MRLFLKEDEYGIIIKRVNNGYIISRLEEMDEGNCIKIEEVHEDNIDHKDFEIHSMHNLLWNIKEHFGLYWNKHNDVNLNIKIEDNKDKYKKIDFDISDELEFKLMKKAHEEDITLNELCQNLLRDHLNKQKE